MALYDPPGWGWYVNYVLTFIAFLCVGVFLFRGGYRQRLRFPMAIATVFWATGHLFANGDLASLILFGGLLSGERGAYGGSRGQWHSPNTRGSNWP